MKKFFTIVLAYDLLLLLQSLKILLEQEDEFQIIGEATDCSTAFEAISTLKPNILIADLLSPPLAGFALIRNVTRKYPDTNALIVSQHENLELIWKSLQCGARGFVPMRATGSDLFEAIRKVGNNEQYLHPPLKYFHLKDYIASNGGGLIDNYESLSNREQEVFSYVAKGQINNEIASKLGVSTRTIEAHRSHLMKKMKFENQAQLVHFATINGLIPNSTTA